MLPLHHEAKGREIRIPYRGEIANDNDGAHDPAADGTDHKLDVGSEADWLPIPSILRHGCSNRRDNRCSGRFDGKFVDYVDKPTL